MIWCSLLKKWSKDITKEDVQWICSGNCSICDSAKEKDMLYLKDIKENDYLIIEPKGYDSFLMDKKEFMQSHWYLDKEDVKVFATKEMYATFDLEYALECIEDDMHEDWLGNVLNSIPEEVKIKIENEVNEYLKKEPTYYPNEEVNWLNMNKR